MTKDPGAIDLVRRGHFIGYQDDRGGFVQCLVYKIAALQFVEEIGNSQLVIWITYLLVGRGLVFTTFLCFNLQTPLAFNFLSRLHDGLMEFALGLRAFDSLVLLLLR